MSTECKNDLSLIKEAIAEISDFIPKAIPDVSSYPGYVETVPNRYRKFKNKIGEEYECIQTFKINEGDYTRNIYVVRFLLTKYVCIVKSLYNLEDPWYPTLSSISSMGYHKQDSLPYSDLLIKKLMNKFYGYMKHISRNYYDFVVDPRWRIAKYFIDDMITDFTEDDILNNRIVNIYNFKFGPGCLKSSNPSYKSRYLERKAITEKIKIRYRKYIPKFKIPDGDRYKRLRKDIDEIYENHQGLEYVYLYSYIGECGYSQYVIKFLDTGFIKDSTASCGIIKDYWHPSIAGVGCVGDYLITSDPINDKLYQSWSTLLIRLKHKGALNTIITRWLICSEFIKDVKAMELYPYWEVDSQHYMLKRISNDDIYRPENFMIAQVNRKN